MSTVEEQELAEQAEREAAEQLEREQADAGNGDGDGDPLEDELLVQLTPDLDLDPDDVDDGQERFALNAPLDESTEKAMEERGKKLDKLGTYVARKLVEIFGEAEADSLELCELCQWTHTYGWRVPVTPPDPVRDAVKRAIGLGTIDEMQSYSAFDTCDTCAGLGNVKTGSQVTEYLYRPCPSCGGRGYSSTLDADVGQQAVKSIVAAMPVVEGGPAIAPDVDMFGTPRGHPDYGKLAQHREVPISHWQSNLPQSS
jgi:hypothetical protein